MNTLITMQISVQIGHNWNWPTGTELGNTPSRINMPYRIGLSAKKAANYPKQITLTILFDIYPRLSLTTILYHLVYNGQQCHIILF